MSIIRKTVSAIGPSAAHVFLPKQLIGKEVWVVSEDDVDELKDLLEKTLLHRRAFEYEKTEYVKRFDDFKQATELRLRCLEKIVLEKDSEYKDPTKI